MKNAGHAAFLHPSAFILHPWFLVSHRRACYISPRHIESQRGAEARGRKEQQTVGIRESLNQNRGVSIGAVSGVLVLTLVWIGYQWGGGPTGGAAPAGSSKVYFSDDDGTTFFADTTDKLPPFDHNGKK